MFKYLPENIQKIICEYLEEGRFHDAKVIYDLYIKQIELPTEI